MDRLLVTDVDDTLTGDDAALEELLVRLRTTPAKSGLRHRDRSDAGRGALRS